MTTITVNIDKASNAKDVMKYLSSLQCVKSVTVNKSKKLVADTNWALQGRPATDEELDILLTDMSNDPDSGVTSHELRDSLAKWKKKYA